MTDTPPNPAPRGWVPSDEGTERGKLHAPAAERNTAPILDVLRHIVAESDIHRALELASGSGQHAIAYAEAFPDITWLPSDRDPAGLTSIAAWRAEAGHDNLETPVHIDLGEPGWRKLIKGPFDLIITCNLLHISPWNVTLNLLAGAAGLLTENGTLFIYGCFSRARDFVSESNRSFDEGLRHRDPSWGVRDTEEIAEAAAPLGLSIVRVVPMPANNTVVVLRRDGDHSGSSTS
jgi:hypothetical protein